MSTASWPSTACAQRSVPDQHSIRWHSERDLPLTTRPASLAPVTVHSKDVTAIERLLPLDEAIRIALNHAEVIRILTGISASNSGQNIYETAIATTAIDNAVANFDPVFLANSSWRKSELAGAEFDQLDPLNALPNGSQTGGNDFTLQLQRRNRLGGTATMRFNNQWRYDDFGPLSRNNRPEIELEYTQPLLAGAGTAFNEAPIVIAQLNVDRSFFSYKSQVQRLVQGVISGYWSLVAARTELWAREKQVEQAKVAFDRDQAQFRVGLIDIGDVSQPRLALANFKANLVLAQANVIQREAALRNVLGIPPEDGQRLVPSTPPTRDRLEFQWVELVETAQRRRPDLIELHLVLLADQQRLIQADNLARPELNARAIQSWNGLRGRAANRNIVSSQLNDNPNWTLGVTFEVPVGLRSSRASLRNSQLVIARDRANISQGLHQTEHELATTVRSLDQLYAQYEAFKETRAAARQNLDVQLKAEEAGLVIFLNVLQAITAWGDAVSSEANALTQYNTALASLEESTGTILDTHGVVFSEERYASIGPGGRKFEDACYPKSLVPQENSRRYENGSVPSEQAFDLKGYDRKSNAPSLVPDSELQPTNPPTSATGQQDAANVFRAASFQNLPPANTAKNKLIKSNLKPAAESRSLKNRIKSLFQRTR
ncbi:MAG: TolC family protein [Fuerstiella sp.]